MSRRILALLLCLPLLSAGAVILSSPAEAAGVTYASTKYIGLSTAGNGYVRLDCNSSKPCKGSVYFADSKPIFHNYSIPARSSKDVLISMDKTSKWFPHTQGTTMGDIKRVRNVKVRVNEKSPKKVKHDYTRVVDTQLPGHVQQLTGTISSVAGATPVKDVKVYLVERMKGGNERIASERVIGDGGGNFSFSIAMTTNNVAKRVYRLKISGKDASGRVHTWWWRGKSGSFWGGSKYMRDSASITMSRHNDFVADFKYGSLTGTIANGDFKRKGVEVAVASPPASYYGSNAVAMNQLDVPRCANIFGSALTNDAGDWRVDFLPATNLKDNYYAIRASYGGNEVWTNKVGSPNNRWASCYGATGYVYTRANLFQVPNDSGTDIIVPLQKPSDTITVNKKLVSGAQYFDGWVTIREKIPGKAILDSPVVAQGKGNSDFKGAGKFTLQPGNYYVETGRRLSCAQWLPSVYPNNNGIFKGLERSAERWKTVAGKAPESSFSVKMGYKPKTPPKGKAGWMYRTYCKALSAGTINSVALRSGDTDQFTATQKKGAIVYGKIKRKGGKTNKEMLVQLSSKGGTLVLRNDLTDGSGKFVVAGLQSGTYDIRVNPDSWRGNKQSFSGRKKITVKAGKTYNVGTLTFQE